ncbi:MAG: nucleotide exchange factor GrpE [Anaerolineae bacterium]|nr:nucleotide exchange factor GrpE [Anaerolineae bacterium]
MAKRKKDPDKTKKNEAAAEVTSAEMAPEEVVTAEVGAAETAEVETETEAEAEAFSLEEQLARSQQEAANNLEGWQRAAAELANFKRRQEEQQKLQRDRIKAEVLEGVLSALDDMELAFQNVPEELNGQLLGWVEGFRLVQRKLDKILEEQNVMPITTEGEFDPNFHEAVSYEESEDHEEGQIIGEVRKGYQVGNRVLRPALVRVAK